MDIETFRTYCLSKPGVTEGLPFGADTLVFKVANKMFALTNIETFESISLKCDPELVPELREKYDEVLPGYHLNKRHWNSILMNGSLPDQLIKEWVDLSYGLVFAKLPKKQKQELLT